MLKSSNIFGDNSLPSYVKRVYTKKKIYDQYLPLSDVENKQLNQLDRYREVFTSNHIEGNSYNEFETTALLKDGIFTNSKPVRDAIEIHNLNRAILFCDSYVGDLNESFIKKVHSLITSGTLDDPLDEGEYKRTANYIGNIHTCPVNAVKKEMDYLINWYNENLNKMDTILLACRFKYRFLVIHPFINGNGRTSRTLFNFILKRGGICPLIIEPNEVPNYYKALKESNLVSDNRDRKFKCEPLEEFLCGELVKFYDKRINLLEGEW